MVEDGIVLGHKISQKGIEVDQSKIEVISKLPIPTNVRLFAVFSDMLDSIEDLLKISRN